MAHDDVIKWKHFPRYWPFVWEFTDHRLIPPTKASDAEPWCFLWSAPEFFSDAILTPSYVLMTWHYKVQGHQQAQWWFDSKPTGYIFYGKCTSQQPFLNWLHWIWHQYRYFNGGLVFAFGIISIMISFNILRCNRLIPRLLLNMCVTSMVNNFK